ncbi:MAG TPA: hypothetical protein VMY40_12915 [Anaerolineae bacterium]|jgi:hypothetical protein|nr:hypothetical protein [Anaerolineae bacterium]
MSENANVQTSTQSRIVALLEGLPPESLTLVERFVQFLRDQARRGQPVGSVSVGEERPSYVYPTVPVPPSSLDGWLDLVPEGYEGDALADTEALYDEV